MFNSLCFHAVPEHLWDRDQQVSVLYGYVERVQEELWFYDGCIVTPPLFPDALELHLLYVSYYCWNGYLIMMKGFPVIVVGNYWAWYFK